MGADTSADTCYFRKILHGPGASMSDCSLPNSKLKNPTKCCNDIRKMYAAESQQEFQKAFALFPVDCGDPNKIHPTCKNRRPVKIMLSSDDTANPSNMNLLLASIVGAFV